MKRIAVLTLGLTAVLSVHFANAAQSTWQNTGTDFNTAANWSAGVPSGNAVGVFSGAAVAQPNLSTSISTAGPLFTTTATGYDITTSDGSTLTLTATATSNSGSGGTNSATAAISALNTTGSNTVDVGLVLAPASGTASTFQQAGGGTLIVNGAISGAAGINLSLRGGGTIQLNGNNSFATGSIDTSGETVVVGNDNGLGAGTFTVNNTATLQAGGGARTVANNIVFGGTTTISGSNAFTFNGTASTAGSNARTVTVSNTGGTTFGGNVVITGNGAPGTLVLNGSSAVAITGVVQDGPTGAGTVRYSGSSTLTLSNTNTYTGGTQLTIAGGTIIGNHDGAFGTGNVSLSAGMVTLTLQNGATQNYIADTASLSYVTTDTINLSYVGIDTVAGLTVDGVVQSAGLYGATGINPDGAFTGTGLILVAAIPEPSTSMLLGLGVLLAAQQLIRRRRRVS